MNIKRPKPQRIRAESDRLAKVRLRGFARRIPNNSALVNMLAQFEGPFRRDFFLRIKPFLRFKPESWEVLTSGLRR